jgi:hypothetical protein
MIPFVGDDGAVREARTDPPGFVGAASVSEGSELEAGDAGAATQAVARLASASKAISRPLRDTEQGTLTSPIDQS